MYQTNTLGKQVYWDMSIWKNLITLSDWLTLSDWSQCLLDHIKQAAHTAWGSWFVSIVSWSRVSISTLATVSLDSQKNLDTFKKLVSTIEISQFCLDSNIQVSISQLRLIETFQIFMDFTSKKHSGFKNMEIFDLKVFYFFPG